MDDPRADRRCLVNVVRMHGFTIQTAACAGNEGTMMGRGKRNRLRAMNGETGSDAIGRALFAAMEKRLLFVNDLTLSKKKDRDARDTETLQIGQLAEDRID
jgi:hypothetical protein